MNKVFSWKKVIESRIDEMNSYDEFLHTYFPRGEWMYECEGKTKEWIKSNTPYMTEDSWLVEKQSAINWYEVPNGAPIKVSCPSYPHDFETTFVGMDEGLVVAYIPEWTDMDWCYDAFDPKWCEVLDG